MSINNREEYDRWKSLEGAKLLKIDFMDTERDDFYMGKGLALIFDDGTRVELSESYCNMSNEKEEVDS